MSVFRLDRLCTLYLYHPFCRIFSDNRSRATVLMYHSVSPVDSSASCRYYQTNTHPKVFQAHMEFLAGNGYSVIPLEGIREKNFIEGDVSRKTVVITFDDGYKDFLEHAYPVLDEFGFPATQFISTGFIGKTLNERPCLDWEDVRFLSRNNVTFGSHTVSHPKLFHLSDREIENEIVGSKDEIEAKLGVRLSTFAYPFAFPQEDPGFIRRIETILKKAEIPIGVTTRIGYHASSDPLFFVKRIPANTHDDPGFFQAKLDGGYDWLSPMQYAKRKIASMFSFKAQ